MSVSSVMQAYSENSVRSNTRFVDPCCRSPGEIIKSDIPWKVFFSFLLTEVEITASYFCLSNMWALPQPLTPDEILSAITFCFFWKTSSPDI